MLQQMDIDINDVMRQYFIEENASIERQYIDAAKDKAYLQ